MEKDDELKGIGNSYNTEFRQYDPRVGRWLSLDPLEHKFPWMSPYVSFNNNPLSYIDSDGLEASDPPSQANVVQSNAIATKAIDKVGNNAAKRSWGARFVSSLLGLEGAEKQHQRGVQLENFIKSEVGKVYDEGSKEYAELFNNTLSQYEESSYLSRVNPKLYNGYNSLLNEHATIEDKFYILANRSQHIKEAYSDKFAMTGLILSAYAAAFPGGGVSSASATSRTFSYLPRYSNVKGASELATVGRWMSQTEFKAMSKTGYVVESKTGTTHVTYPANPKAFTPNDKNSIFVTFKVPKSALKTTNAEGVKQWAKIIGPNSLEARLAALKKAQVPQMPKATDIKVLK